MSTSRIYTKMGDDGSTGLLYGGRTSKAASLMEAVGSIDETVSTLGLARAQCPDPEINAAVLSVQRDLFVAAADLVTNPHARDRLVAGISLVTPAMVTRLERLIDERMAAHPLRPVFVVPGANVASAALDMARTQVRRAERRLVGYAQGLDEQEIASLNAQVGIYLNRVSDLLYVLARQAAGDEEEPASHDGKARA
ncbi:MAG: cob(I)yrinic acid a,c-diamide adenosyltransferase [Burkholderiaceae bacterium]|nr:MAG: cob(I)yrinic acid a,c-diamide adenosyltransferase [Burkholderiaceae bacterium]